MSRPSGTCNGQPCYTAADKAEIAAEKADKEAEAADLQAQLELVNDEIAALSHEAMTANANSCP